MRSRAVLAGTVATVLVTGLALAAPAHADDPEPAPAVFDGTVTVGGAPLQGATVRLTGGASPVESLPTDAAGHYSVEAPAGTYLVCAGMKDDSVHHSCSPGSALGTGAHTWTVADGGQQTLDYTLEASDQPLMSTLTGTTAAWRRTKNGYRLVYGAGPLVYRPAKGVGAFDVEVAAMRTSGGVVEPFLADLQRLIGFAKYPSWSGIAPLPAVQTGPILFDDAAVCGLPGQSGRTYAVPTVVQQLRRASGTVLLTRTAAVDESACRRDKLTVALRGAIRSKRRQLRLSAHTDSVVQAYRPMVRVYRSTGKLLGKRRLRADGSIKPIVLPKKFRKGSLAIKVVLPPTDGSPRFVVRRTVRFPKR